MQCKVKKKWNIMQITKGVFAIFLVFFDSCQNRIYFYANVCKSIIFCYIWNKMLANDVAEIFSYITEYQRFSYRNILHVVIYGVCGVALFKTTGSYSMFMRVSINGFACRTYTLRFLPQDENSHDFYVFCTWPPRMPRFEWACFRKVRAVRTIGVCNILIIKVL